MDPHRDAPPPVSGAPAPGSAEPGSAELGELGEAFCAELTHWREVRGLSKKRLAAQMGFDPSYISHIESGRHRPTADFVRRAESVLNSSHALWRRWQNYDAARRAAGADAVPREAPVANASAAIVVDHEDSRLRYGDGYYRVLTRRRLRNAGGEPISRYLMRISVDRFPDDPDRSNQLYRARPLTWAELRLAAQCEGEPMAWKAKHDRDAFKEVWLLFENDTSRFPLYPGESTWIEYGYQVSEDKWGSWFQRAIRLPTNRLTVTLSFPAGLDPAVWGTETSMTAFAAPFRTAIGRRRAVDDDDGREQAVFTWAIDRPALHARYRLEWRFRGRPGDPNGGSGT
jgi:transcriptional regulator with XRE-family HTH domain